MSSDTVCVDFWANGFGMRVRIALHEKGVEYEFQEEDLRVPQRSQLVLEMNPVHRSIPILIHRRRPIIGSLNIVEYIDETWKESTCLLPTDPFKRAEERFWAQFIDEKFFAAQTKFLKSKGEDKEEAKAGLIEDLKRLEGVLGDGMYFGGQQFSFLDIALIPFSSMFHGYEKHGNFKMEMECPKLMAWVNRCMAKESVSKTLPNAIEMYDLHQKWYGIV